LSNVDREQFRQQLRMIHDWDKIILVDPLNPKRAFEL
jgi:hypothetical protein